MRLLVVILVTLIAAVAVALLAARDPGYLMISVGSWTVETTLSLAIVVTVLAFALVYYLIRISSRLRRLPHDLRAWRQHRRERKSHQSLNQGLIALTEGRWSAAERNSLKFADHDSSSLLHYLAAARAAQAQGAEGRRDRYLKLAYESHPDANVVVGLTQAELQMKQGQLELALATLRHLHQLAPKQAQVLKALTVLYRQLGDWEHLLEILPALQKQRVVTDGEWLDMQREAYLALLRKARPEQLKAVWSRIPRSAQDDQQILQVYVECLMSLGESDLAEPLIRHSLKRQKNSALLRLYGLINAPEPRRQLQLVESLLEETGSDPDLLLTAGRLSLRNQLWGKARSYLEASVNLRPSAEAYHDLGNLLEQLGETEAAGESFRAGLALAPGCEHAIPIRVTRKSLQQDPTTHEPNALENFRRAEQKHLSEPS